jgi:hypothetical protein
MVPRVSRKSFVLGTTHRMIFVEEKISAGVGKKLGIYVFSSCLL